MSRRAVEAHAANCFTGLERGEQSPLHFFPIKRSLPGANHFDGLHRIPVGVEILDHQRGLVAAFAATNFFAANRKTDLERRHLPAVHDRPLQHHGAASRVFVGEGHKILALGCFTGFEGELPLVVPGNRVPVLFVDGLETAVMNLGMFGIRFHLAIGFRLARHGNEQRREQPLLDEHSVSFFEHIKDLFVALAQGNDHLAPFFQLVDQGLRHTLGRAGDDDFVERCSVRPAFVAVSDLRMHVLVLQVFEDPGGPLAQWLDDFDRVHIFD